MAVGNFDICDLFLRESPNGGLLKYIMCNSGIGDVDSKYGSQTESLRYSDTSSVAPASSGTID